ncbi:hypothetical protein ACIQV3_11475 [Streptomyces sp. NPDC099050]|uniref:hypothetical protein n=1 Tax=Streptomyces sp. NPDC099050 TaxID=3366100 RepID=UPI003807EA24
MSDEQQPSPVTGAVWTPSTIRRASAGRPEIDQPAAAKLREKMLALLDEYDKDRERHRAQQEAAHGLASLAERYAATKSFEERDDIAEQFGESLTLAEAGLIRRVAKAVEGALPGMIVDAHVDGWSAPEIASEVTCSARHAYQVIRDNPWEALWVLYRDVGNGKWESVASGPEETTETADDLAERILASRVGDDVALSRSGARVCVWRAGDGDDPDKARGEAEHEGDTQLDH